MFPVDWVQQANNRIAPYIHQTELRYDPEFDIYLKLENRQVTGSFKARGALNKVFTLNSWEIERGLVAASAGNHGQGVAYAGKIVNAKVTVFCSENAVANKIEAMRELGAVVNTVPGGYGEAEKTGKQYAAENGGTWISPYNDSQVLAGQGTAALEILEINPGMRDAVWIVPVGGGGLISGIGAVIKDGSSRARLIGVQSTASAFMYEVFTKGNQAGAVDLPSIADGLAGPVEERSITIPMVQSLVDDIILVTEDEIERAIALSWFRYNEIIEGSAAAALAAAISGKIAARPACLLISGGNIQKETHQDIIHKHQVTE